MAASTANLKPSVGSSSNPTEGRLHLVYAAHQRLEDELSTLLAYTAAARKHNGNDVPIDESFSPWAGLIDSAAKCVDATSRCLRLFNPSRSLKQYKGMLALAKLYDTGAAPHERVIAFLSHISEAFGGVLPVEIALSGGYCLQRIDPAFADDYLVTFVSDWVLLESAAGEQADPFRRRFRDLLSTQNEQSTFQHHLRAVMLLQIECAAQSGHQEHVLAAYDMQALNSVLAPAIRDELGKYETTCWQDAVRHRERESGAAAPLASAAPATTLLTKPSPQKDQEMQERTSSEVRRGGVTVPPYPEVRGWRWGVIRMGVLILLAVVIRFASGPLGRALRSSLQVTRVAPPRPRTLTL
ncbi:hypothetical protein JKF63_04983 [Porcisia hertigi]|uniref:Uncharacterized protein n=1 Tax=Porcisia hertigi TaxID=2761500 RepID=A0A836IWI1_9TRYP|nr:hypothetical protein JKF63_04983 [Porcisia hertigi]